MGKSSQDDITVWGLDGECAVVKAPPDFDWLHYPETLEVNNRHYVYRATQDSIPVYQEVK